MTTPLLRALSSAIRASRELFQSKATIERLRAERDAAEVNQRGFEWKASCLENELSALRDMLARTQGYHAETEDKLNFWRDRASKTEHERDEAKTELSKAQEELETLQGHHKRLRTELIRLRAEDLDGGEE